LEASDEVSGGKKEANVLDDLRKRGERNGRPERKIRGSQMSWLMTCVSCMVLVTLATTRPIDAKDTVPIVIRRNAETRSPKWVT